MPSEPVNHYNPSITKNLTRCGLRLTRVKNWTPDKNDATCNNCIRLIAKDAEPRE